MEPQSRSACNVCGKKFQRKAHLLRHQQQHSGDRPHSCKFCFKTFKRSDVLRDHFSRCERRGNSAIPNSLERGRKRHACDECSRLKVKCDNNAPCRKCKEFGRPCVKSRLLTSSPNDTPRETVSRSMPDLSQSDRNSIGFLLNAGNAMDFMREFPKSTTLSPNSRSVDYQGMMASRNSYDPIRAHDNDGLPPYQEYGQMGQAVPENNLDVMLRNLEFATFERENWQVSAENQIPWRGPEGGFINRQVLDQRAFEIKDKLRYTASTQSIPHPTSKEALDRIERISADSIATNIKLYFRHWHKHAPMVHEATFNPCSAALPLVMALMSLGGMYSKDEAAVRELKSLLDIIEAYIYSLPGISDEYDLPGRTYVVQGEHSSPEWQQYQLEELQGAYLMIVLQFWTGNPIARVRVRQQRFQRIVSIFHHLDLLITQHLPNDQISDQPSFRRWVRKESYLRTVNLAVMLDHAFGIFNNVSPRFQWAEIDLPFISDDRYFNLVSYADLEAQSLYPQQKMKVKDAYLILFSSSHSADQDLNVLRTANLTVLDLQMLIHYIYTHVWKSTFSNPLATTLIQSTVEILAPFKNAMRNWRILWDDVRRSFPESEWAKVGFQRTAETYFDAVGSLMSTFEKRSGKFPPIPSDCEKGSHLRRLLTL
ncbi:hypothetical protein BJ875DRAFT_478678 [Amylocarpus encephaloides]|uniref:Zn(2)-C6 fungal-type domain-containing protein n=1 Tax=Amylocarpus encephaloides TaxID=45428 RepID=A0A9P7Y603_9HELO|nr:hypothetical protein BJ875DRAFT_478678 [Amylocarpus encephaloides]